MATRTTINLTTFDGYVVNRLGNSVFWPSAERRELINESLRTWNVLTGTWRRRILLTTVANQIFYTLPATMTFGTRVMFNNIGIDQGSIYDWDQGNPYWMADRDDPDKWAPVGLTRLAIHPIDPRGQRSLTVDGVSATPQLSVAGDFIDIGQEDFQAILDYIQHMAAFKEGGEEFKSTFRLYQNFVGQAAKRNAKLKASLLYRRVVGIDPTEASKPRRAGSEQLMIGAR